MPPRADYLKEYEVGDYIADAAVVPGSPLVDATVGDAAESLGAEADIVQIIREGDRSIAPYQDVHLGEGDILVVRTDRDAITALEDAEGVEPVGYPDSAVDLSSADGGIVTELVIALDSRLVGERLDPEGFREEFGAAVLGLRRRGALIGERIVGKRLDVGDTLLVQAPSDTLDRLSRRDDVIVTRDPSTGRTRHRSPSLL